MKIAIVSKLWENTEKDSLGGTGAGVGNLIDGLVKNGHEITLFATGNSKTKAQELISVRENPFANDYSEVQEFENISNAFKSKKKFDLIHCAVEYKSLFFSEISKIPVLHSIRYGECFEQELNILKKYKNENFVGISKAIVNKFSFLNFLGFVYNGIDLNNFSFNENAGEYFLFLARVSPQKGVGRAIEAAKKLGKKLIIAGKISSTDEEYLQKNFWPYIDNEQIIYKGEVGFEEKIELLKNSLALLHPIENIFEAFGMSLIEAQACGTPVISFDNGSPKEVIKNGETGFVVSNWGEFLEACNNIGSIDRKKCRDWVKNNFTITKMVRGYEDIYKKIINR
jgi:glycosyltransferase involved in cell wall biosynthesis